MDTHEFREVGHRMVDLLSEYLEHIEERPLFADVEPAKLNKLFAEPLPQNPSSSDEVLQQIQEKLLPYCTHVGHPGYFGLITPSPNLMGRHFANSFAWIVLVPCLPIRSSSIW